MRSHLRRRDTRNRNTEFSGILPRDGGHAREKLWSSPCGPLEQGASPSEHPSALTGAERYIAISPDVTDTSSSGPVRCHRPNACATPDHMTRAFLSAEEDQSGKLLLFR